MLEDRQRRRSVIVTSQLPIKLWHWQFQGPTLADAILDRLVHNAELVELAGESLRKKHIGKPVTLPGRARNLVAVTHSQRLPALALHCRTKERQARLLAEASAVQRTASSDRRGAPEA